jgi:hypothetical protein
LRLDFLNCRKQHGAHSHPEQATVQKFQRVGAKGWLAAANPIAGIAHFALREYKLQQYEGLVEPTVLSLAQCLRQEAGADALAASSNALRGDGCLVEPPQGRNQQQVDDIGMKLLVRFSIADAPQGS